MRMLVDGLAHQPGDALSMVATAACRLALNQGELIGPGPLTS